MKYLALYGLTALGFFAIDFVWLSRIAVSFYDKHLGHIMRDEPIIWAAAAFYALYLVGVVVFAVLPGLPGRAMAHYGHPGLPGRALARAGLRGGGRYSSTRASRGSSRTALRAGIHVAANATAPATRGTPR